MDGIVKIAWVPPEFGDAVACVCADGTLSLWEEDAEDAQPLQWKLCTSFNSGSAQLIDTQFGVSPAGLKMVTTYSDARVKFYELLNPLELKNWQLQAEFQELAMPYAYLHLYLGIHKGEKARNQFLFWVSIQTHHNLIPPRYGNLIRLIKDGSQLQSWLNLVTMVIRSMQLRGHRTLEGYHKGISIWHLGLNPDLDGRLSLENIALLSGHKGEVWQMEWDMSGMTLAITGNDGAVRLWQSSLNGVWHEEATFEPTS